METKKSNSINLLKPLKAATKRFHLTFFFVFIVGCLSGSVLLLSNILQDSSTDPGYISPISAGSIDEATLSRLNDLHTSSEGTTAPVFPEGRINPLGE